MINIIAPEQLDWMNFQAVSAVEIEDQRLMTAPLVIATAIEKKDSGSR